MEPPSIPGARPVMNEAPVELRKTTVFAAYTCLVIVAAGVVPGM
jgi:hypothetical protein